MTNAIQNIAGIAPGQPGTPYMKVLFPVEDPDVMILRLLTGAFLLCVAVMCMEHLARSTWYQQLVRWTVTIVFAGAANFMLIGGLSTLFELLGWRGVLP